MTDARGYSSRIVEKNKGASKSSPGVMLGRVCITQEIPVSEVAKYFGVSRMTIYKWFKGLELPRQKHTEKIEALLKRYKQKVRLDK